MTAIAEFLNAEVTLLRSIRTARQFGDYVSCSDFVLKHGRERKHKPYPKQYRAMRMQMCFANAARLVLSHPEDLIYCEGYACGEIPIPLAHAWTLDKDGNVVDPTWHGRGKYCGGKEYVGVAILTKYLIATALKTEWHCSIIDNYRMKWPILQDDPKLWRHPINDL
jgi:hypothetical protein